MIKKLKNNNNKKTVLFQYKSYKTKFLIKKNKIKN